MTYVKKSKESEMVGEKEIERNKGRPPKARDSRDHAR